MKTKTWPDDAGVPEIDDWPHMNDWLAGLRDEGPADPPDDDRAETASHGDPRPEAVAAAPASRPAARAETTARTEMTVRAVIGDQLRMPTAWCELGTCISRHTQPGALGEADIRARAIRAGWRFDALGRLACPRCQQAAPEFRSPLPVALWDRDKAITMAARVTANATEISHDLRPPASGYPPASYRPASPWETGRHRERPAGKTAPASPREPGRHRSRRGPS